MAEWRIGRGWTASELERRLEQAQKLQVETAVSVRGDGLEDGWKRVFSEAIIATEEPGEPVPDGPFERGKVAVASFAFSDPRIVIGHFDADAPLRGRRMLLELRALRYVRFLTAVAVSDTRSDQQEGESCFGFRYDTLAGHIEEGAEWFLLKKSHATGDITFRIEAKWRPGDFPNWWSRAGFFVLGPYYQKRWHYRAHRLLADITKTPGVQPPQPDERRLVHSHPQIIFRRQHAIDD